MQRPLVLRPARAAAAMRWGGVYPHTYQGTLRYASRCTGKPQLILYLDAYGCIPARARPARRRLCKDAACCV
jgi:hypothetical protein